jgi:uncharacterized protein (DUF362 family)
MNELFYKNEVAVIKTIDHYDVQVPFDPPALYPEFSGTKNSKMSGFNPIYDSVRKLFIALELDKERIDSGEWNPLSGLIVPGNKVFIKPNLVRENNGIGQDMNSMVTHASVIRPIIDYVHLALEGRGEIVIGDAPVPEANFQIITNKNHLQPTIGYLSNLYRSEKFAIKLIDMRFARGSEEEFHEFDHLGIEIDLKQDSFLDLFSDKELENLTYLYEDNSFMTKVHNRLANKYRIAREFLDADVFINVPKLKTHYKAGVTLSLKNLIGLATNKSYIPHLRNGPPSRNGDATPDYGLMEKIGGEMKRHKNDLKRKFLYLCSNLAGDKAGFIRRIETKYRLVKPPKGCWQGNDTIWRVALDLNRILLFADKNGVMGSGLQRRIFNVIDGIVGGEKNGPLHCLKKPAGILVGGHNPYAVDLTATRLMGFDHEKIPLMRNARKEQWLINEGPVVVSSNIPDWNTKDLARDYHKMMPDLDFIEPDNWPIKIQRS